MRGAVGRVLFTCPLPLGGGLWPPPVLPGPRSSLGSLGPLAAFSEWTLDWSMFLTNHLLKDIPALRSHRSLGASALTGINTRPVAFLLFVAPGRRASAAYAELLSGLRHRGSRARPHGFRWRFQSSSLHVYAIGWCSITSEGFMISSETKKDSTVT